MSERSKVGFTCAYTPIPLLHAAGLTPWRIRPEGDAQDMAGSLLHDNLCPEVKRILDRKLAGELPEMAGTVFLNSCDSMRRLANAWVEVDAPGRVHLMDLPTIADDRAVAYFAERLEVLRGVLGEWSGTAPTDDDIRASVALYNRLFGALNQLAGRSAEGAMSRVDYQRWLNRSVEEPPEETLAALEAYLAELVEATPRKGIPLMLFGNVLPDPAAARIFEECGARIVADDLCTGSRQLTPVEMDDDRPVLPQLAAAILRRPYCSRTMEPGDPAALTGQLTAMARGSNARGAVAHVVKFCDPYLLRLPAIRAAFKAEGIPLLVLEGDCTLRSLGQQQTRIEAFVEMLWEAS